MKAIKAPNFNAEPLVYILGSCTDFWSVEWLAFTLDKQQLVPMAALLTLVSVILLTLLSLLLQQPTIETDLLQRTRQALAEAGLPADIIHFNGRDGVLTGTVASEAEAERLQTVVDSVYGVRDVENRPDSRQ